MIKDLDKTLKEMIIKINAREVEISDDTDLFKDLGFDSLDMVELVLEIEREYDIKIPDYEITEKSITFKDVKDYIEQKKG